MDSEGLLIIDPFEGLGFLSVGCPFGPHVGAERGLPALFERAARGRCREETPAEVRVLCDCYVRGVVGWILVIAAKVVVGVDVRQGEEGCRCKFFNPDPRACDVWYKVWLRDMIDADHALEEKL